MTATSGPADVHCGASLASHMAASLPPDGSPQLHSAYDAIGLAAHASMLAVGFRLVGLGEDDGLELATADSPSPLPKEWNASPGAVGFRYAHTQSSMQFLLKVTRMGNKAVVMGMALGADRTCSVDVTAREYVAEGRLPLVRPGGGDDEVPRRVMDVFVSEDRLGDFGSLMRVKIIQKLAPGIYKEGYEESTTKSPRAPARPPRDPLRDHPPPRDPLRHDPLRHDPLAPPRRPLPDPLPGFDDEHEALARPRGGFGVPPHYGDRDLYPAGLGPRDPLYGGVGPGLGPRGGGGGMHPTFDDPMFAQQGRGGDDGYDMRAPPGSRYDPVGPGRGGHPRGAGMGGRPPNPFGGFGGGDFI